MRRFGVTFGLVLVFGAAAARANEFTFSWHEASGSGSANVFDGGPVVSDSTNSGGPNSPGIGFSAVDDTGPGSSNAIASVLGRSQIFDVPSEEFGAEGIKVLVDFRAAYFPSLFPSGDRPGGMAEASLSSVIEFEMPADEIVWAYQLLIRDTSLFSGSTSVVVENVTQSETLLTLTEQMFAIKSTLSGNTGDLIRITSQMSGSGSAPAGITSSRSYTSNLGMVFLVPEPSTLALLLFGALLTRKRPLL